MEHIEELSESLYKMKGFSRKKGGARELLRKENKGLGQGQLFFRGREWEEFLSCQLLLWEIERIHVTDYFTGA